jgi:hypothetical protein
MAAMFMTLAFSPSTQAKGIAASTLKGQVLYTQFSLYYENSRHLTTNYRKGILVPVNTEVKFVESNSTDILVSLPDGENLYIENVEAYSGEEIDGIFTRTLAEKPVDLAPYSVEERKAILAGEVVPGMSKNAVILALGYPPKHRTPSLQLDHWQYWRNRFKTFLVYFENGKVVRIQN